MKLVEAVGRRLGGILKTKGLTQYEVAQSGRNTEVYNQRHCRGKKEIGEARYDLSDSCGAGDISENFFRRPHI